MTTPNEYERFIQLQAEWYNLDYDDVEYIIQRGKQLYYQSLADWAEFDMLNPNSHE